MQVEVPSRNAVLEFPDGTDESVISQTIQREFPRNGADVSFDLGSDPSFINTMDIEDYLKFEKHSAEKKTEWGKLIGDAASHVSGIIGTGLANLVTTNPLKQPGSIVEGAAQGTRSFYDMVAQSQNPGSPLFKFKNLITGDGTELSRFEQFKEASKEASRMAQAMSGKNPLLIPKEYQTPGSSEFYSLFLDPTLLAGLLPGIGEAAVGAKVASLGARGIGKGLELAGAASKAALRPASELISAGERLGAAALGASGMGEEAGRIALRSSGLTGALAGVPGVETAAAVIGGVKTGEKAADVLEAVGKGLQAPESRIGVLEAYGMRPNATGVDRAIGFAGRAGADPALRLGLAGLEGSLHGTAIGTALGGLSGGEEGIASGIGFGSVLGGFGGTTGRILGAGNRAKQLRANDLATWIGKQDAETKANFQTLVERHGVDVATTMADTADWLSGQLGDAKATFLSDDQFSNRFGNKARGVQVVTGENPEVVVNIDRFGRGKGDSPLYTLGHEVAHALDSIEQLSDKSAELKQALVGSYITNPDGSVSTVKAGLFTPDEINARFEEYRKKLTASQLSPDQLSAKLAEYKAALEKQGLPKAEIDTALARRSEELQSATQNALNELAGKTDLKSRADFLAGELMSEYMGRMLAGAKPDSMLRGFSGKTAITDYLLANRTEGAISKILNFIGGTGLKNVESPLFEGLKSSNNSVNVMLRDLVRARRNLREAIDVAESGGGAKQVFSRADILKPELRDKFVDLGLVVKTPDGKYRKLTPQELTEKEAAVTTAVTKSVENTKVADPTKPHMQVIDGELVGDRFSPEQLDAIRLSRVLTDRQMEALQIINNAGDASLIVTYAAATKRTKLPSGAHKSTYSSKIPIDSRENVFNRIYKSKAGNLVANMFKAGLFESDARNLASSGKLGAWGKDVKQFVSDAQEYLKLQSNPSTPQGSAEARFGKAKTDYLSAMLGKTKEKTGNKYFHDYRIDRIVSIVPGDKSYPITERGYQRAKANWMPADKIGETTVRSSEEGYRTIKGTRGYRLYKPDGSLAGVFAKEMDAMGAANKSVAKENARFMPKDSELPSNERKRPFSEEARSMMRQELDSPGSLNKDRLQEALDDPASGIPTRMVSIPTKNTLPSNEDIRFAMGKRLPAKGHIGEINRIEDGAEITSRQDVPSYTEHKLGVVTVMDTKSGTTVYVSHVVMDNPNMMPMQAEQSGALRIGAGDAKSPTIKIKATKSKDQSLPDDLDKWTQVGFNPDRHSYYYLRSDGSTPVVGGSKAVQVGNTVFVKDPVFSDKYDSAFRFMPSEEPRFEFNALHNISPDALKFADELGGLPVPSIGVTKAGKGYSGFGAITLIGGKSLGDPSSNPIFSADAYSARFPKPEWKPVKESVVKPVVDKFREFSSRFEPEYNEAIGSIWDNAINKPNPNETIRLLSKNNSAKAAFLKLVLKKDSEPILSPVSSRFGLADAPAFTEYLNKNNGEIPNFVSSDRAGLKELGDVIKASIDQKTQIEIQRNALTKRLLDENGEASLGPLYLLQKDASNLGKVQVDQAKTTEMLDSKLRGKEKQFAEWISKTIGDMYSPPRIKVDGRFVPYTAENIAQAMQSAKIAGEEKTMTFGAGQALAAGARKFSSLDEMRTYGSWQLDKNAEGHAIRESARLGLEALRTELADYYKYNDTWSAMDAVGKALSQYFQGHGGGESAMKVALRKSGFTNVPKLLIDKAVSAARAVNEAPRKYFESKPQRVVGLNEFKAAIVPKGTSRDTINILKKHGIEVKVLSEKQSDNQQAIDSAIGKLGAEHRFMPASAEIRQQGTKQHLEFWNRELENSGIKDKPTTMGALNAFIRENVANRYSSPNESLFPKIDGEKIKAYYKKMVRDASTEQAATFPPNWHDIRSMSDVEFNSAFGPDRVNSITEKRVNELAKSANYLLAEIGTEKAQGTYTPAEVAAILDVSAKIRVNARKDESGNLQAVTQSIGSGNEAMPNEISGATASKIAEYMRQGMSSKDAYTKGVFDVMKASSEKRGNATGWKKYTQSGDIKDAESLNADLAGTNWCTGGSVGTASLHLSGGDFYVYFKNGDPQIAIRTDNGKIEEVRGRGEGQNITSPELNNVAETFIRSNEGPQGGDDYLHDQNFRKASVEFAKTGKLSEEAHQWFDQNAKFQAPTPKHSYSSEFAYEYLKPFKDLMDKLDNWNFDQQEVLKEIGFNPLKPDGTLLTGLKYSSDDSSNAKYIQINGKITSLKEDIILPNLVKCNELVAFNGQAINLPALIEAHTIRSEPGPTTHTLPTSLIYLPSLNKVQEINAGGSELFAPNVTSIEKLKTLKRFVSENLIEAGSIEAVEGVELPNLKKATSIRINNWGKDFVSLFPNLVEVGSFGSDEAKVNLPSLKRANSIWSSAIELSAPLLTNAKRIDFSDAKIVDLSSLNPMYNLYVYRKIEKIIAPQKVLDGLSFVKPEAKVPSDAPRFMPSSNTGTTKVWQSPSGFRMMQVLGSDKFRVYNPSGSLNGVYKSQSEAEKRISKMISRN